MRANYSSIAVIADAVIEQVQSNRDPFVTPTVVFHNLKIAQWFKAYYLKKYESVLMNVRFETLSVYLNGLLNPQEQHHIIAGAELRDYIIKILAENYAYNAQNAADPINYIFDDTGKLDGIRLYDFSGMLSSLFMNYEYDEEDINGWQKEIYCKAISLAEKDDCYTTKSLFNKVRETPEFQKECRSRTEPVYIIDNSYITELYQNILNYLDESVVFQYSLAPTEQAALCDTVMAAPSVLREVEAVHSKICKTISENENIRFNDFLVYAPDINLYANTIDRVFKQDDSNFPAIPYCIVGAAKEQRDMTDSLAVLSDIANARFFTRSDLMRFAKNAMVKYVWEIDDEEIEHWMDAINATNTFRNGKSENDWDYLKKRLLLPLLVSDESNLINVTTLDVAEYLPYRSISLENNSVNKLVDLIDALLNWCNAFSGDLNDIVLKKDNLEDMGKLLDALYSKKGSDGEEVNYLYRTILGENERIKRLDVAIPANTWLRLLEDAPKRYLSHPANMFAAGVTFMSLDCDNIVTEPYVFVMGLSSQVFPRIEMKNEINESKKHRTSEALDKLSIRNICAEENHRVFSYVNRDLIKDSECYPSSLMPTAQAGSEVIPLDENREYSELFTQKEFLSKEYHKNLAHSSTGTSALPLAPIANQNMDTVIGLRDIKSFLENTFVYKFNHLLSKRREDEEIAYNNYEPIDSNPLTKSVIVKEIVKTQSTDGKRNSILKRKLPEKEIGEICYREYEGEAEKIREIIDQGYEFRVLEPLCLSYADKDGQTICWILECNADMFVKENDNELCYIAPALGNKLKHFFTPYAFSLMDVAGRTTETEYSIQLNAEEKTKHYSVCPSDAREILKELFIMMSDYSDTAYMDSTLLEKIAGGEGKGNDQVPKNISDFESSIWHETSWQYFADRNMVSTSNDFGYNEQIHDQIKAAYDRIKPLIRFL